MSGVLCILGASALLLAAILTGGGYASYLRGRAGEYRAFVGFLELMRREISSFLSTPAELALRADDPLLIRIGFIGALRDGASLGEAFDGVKDGLSMSERDISLLSELFCGFGKGSAEGELRALDGRIAELSQRSSDEESSLPSRIRLARTLLTLGALGIVIILL